MLIMYIDFVFVIILIIFFIFVYFTIGECIESFFGGV